jgi:hypothetical protein
MEPSVSTSAHALPNPDWQHAVELLRSAKTPESQLSALVEFASRLGAALPPVSAAMPGVVALLRAAIAEPEFIEAMTGEAASVIDVADLPLMTADDFAVEAVATAGARNRVLEQQMLTATAVSQLLASGSTNMRQYANRLRAKGDLVAVPSRNRYLYPAFQIDAERRSIRQPVADVNRLLDAAHDPWGASAWWIQPSEYLAGASPAEELAREGGPERVLALAHDVALGA